MSKGGAYHEFMERDFSVKVPNGAGKSLLRLTWHTCHSVLLACRARWLLQHGIPARKTAIICTPVMAKEMLRGRVTIGSKLFAGWMNLRGLPHGVLFATRPFNLPELFILNDQAYSESQRANMRAAVRAARGFDPAIRPPCLTKTGCCKSPITRPPKHTALRFRVGRPSWIAGWLPVLSDPDADRYARMCRLIDGVISQPHQSRYLILPELALPAHWFIRIARKLQGKGISLICVFSTFTPKSPECEIKSGPPCRTKAWAFHR